MVVTKPGDVSRLVWSSQNLEIVVRCSLFFVHVQWVPSSFYAYCGEETRENKADVINNMYGGQWCDNVVNSKKNFRRKLMY
jgi:hypothetical protein